MQSAMLFPNKLLPHDEISLQHLSLNQITLYCIFLQFFLSQAVM